MAKVFLSGTHSLINRVILHMMRMAIKHVTTSPLSRGYCTYEKSWYSGIRFSISWSRIFPDGIVKDSDGNIRYNKAGLDFYDKIVNLCLENNIEPFITIYTGIYLRHLKIKVDGSTVRLPSYLLITLNSYANIFQTV